MSAIRYAVVPSAGRHGSGDMVRAVSVHADRATAIRRAERLTREHQAAMRRYGGTSGGYRVVETEASSARTARWQGMDVDALPSVTEGASRRRWHEGENKHGELA